MIWTQIRLARKLALLSDEELFHSLLVTPASLWKLSGKGAIHAGKDADIVITKKKDNDNLMNSFFLTNPEDILLIVKSGKTILYDGTLKTEICQHKSLLQFEKIYVNNFEKYVKPGVRELVNKIKNYNSQIRLPIEIE